MYGTPMYGTYDTEDNQDNTYGTIVGSWEKLKVKNNETEQKPDHTIRFGGMMRSDEEVVRRCWTTTKGTGGREEPAH